MMQRFVTEVLSEREEKERLKRVASACTTLLNHHVLYSGDIELTRLANDVVVDGVPGKVCIYITTDLEWIAKFDNVMQLDKYQSKDLIPGSGDAPIQ